MVEIIKYADNNGLKKLVDQLNILDTVIKCYYSQTCIEREELLVSRDELRYKIMMLVEETFE